MAPNANPSNGFLDVESLSAILADDKRQDSDVQSLATILNTARAWDEWSIRVYPEEMTEAFRVMVDEARAILHRNS